MTADTQWTSGLSFELPKDRHGSVPAEARGLRRDDIAMLVADTEGVHHHRLRDLPDILSPGDVLVVNTSATIAAGLTGRTDGGEAVAVHLSTALPGTRMTTAAALRSASSRWVVELRSPTSQSSRQMIGQHGGSRVRLDGGGVLRVGTAYPTPAARVSRLWAAHLSTTDTLGRWLEHHGSPISYSHVTGRWPIEFYRTPFARTRGSAEMPSAGRGLTSSLLARLSARGVRLARIVLHCGVSSLEVDEAPYAEWFSVPAASADAVNRARAEGRRVVAVGTTVVRALESAVGDDAIVRAARGWTSLVIAPGRGVTAIDGLLTGWHEPRASHLRMLEAFAGAEALERSYQVALASGYRWHEFGDAHLLLR